MAATDPPEATVKVRARGPYKLTGCFRVVTADGEVLAEVDHDGDVVLCRCGASADKPFCDGSHAVVGFAG